MVSSAESRNSTQAGASAPLELLGGRSPARLLSCDGATPTVLAFHGFGASPHEVEMLVEVARDLGLAARAPLLPGHGSTVADLAQSRWADWRSAAVRWLEGCPDGPVVCAGLSTGALLALDLAATFPERVSAVVSLATPLRLTWPFPALAMKLYCGVGLPDFSLPKKLGPDIRDPGQRASQITSRAQPAYAGNEVRLAGRYIEGRLGRVRCPVLIAHGRYDHVAPHSNAKRTYAALGTAPHDKQLLILPRSYHVVTRDVDRGLLRGSLYDFLQTCRAVSAAGAAGGA